MSSVTGMVHHHHKSLTSCDSEELAGESSSRGCEDITYMQIRGRVHIFISDLLAAIAGHPHAAVYAVMIFHDPEDFRAACRGVRDLHGLNAG